MMTTTRLCLSLLFAHAAVLLSSLLILPTTYAMTVSKVAVIGATGRLGRLTVQQLVDRGIECRILSRKKPDVPLKELPEDATSAQVAAYLSSLPGVGIVQGDVSNVQALQELCSDCEACIAVYGATRRSKISDLWKHPEDEDPTHAKQVNYQGVQNIIQACKASNNCKRIVRITGKGEDPTGIFSVLINMLGSMAKAWNYEGERALRGQSDVDYTIIRPGVMSEEGAGEGASLTLADDGQDLPVAKVAYADIATLCIDCLDYDNAARTTLTAMTTTEGGEKTWKPMLATVKPDRRSFPDDMLEQHYAAVKNTVLKLGGVSVLVLAVLVKLLVF